MAHIFHSLKTYAPNSLLQIMLEGDADFAPTPQRFSKWEGKLSLQIPPLLGLLPGRVLSPFHSQTFVLSLGIRNPYCYGRIAAESYIHPPISKQQNVSTAFIN